jgi:hypothetical protein
MALKRGGMNAEAVAEAMKSYDEGVKPLTTCEVEVEVDGVLTLPSEVVCNLWPELGPGCALVGEVTRHRSGEVSLTLTPATVED